MMLLIKTLQILNQILLLLTISTITIKTIEGVTEFELVERYTYENTLDAIRAMRCTTRDEADKVIAALRSKKPMVHLSLRGF